MMKEGKLKEDSTDNSAARGTKQIDSRRGIGDKWWSEGRWDVTAENARSQNNAQIITLYKENKCNKAERKLTQITKQAMTNQSFNQIEFYFLVQF